MRKMSLKNLMRRAEMSHRYKWSTSILLRKRALIPENKIRRLNHQGKVNSLFFKKLVNFHLSTPAEKQLKKQRKLWLPTDLLVKPMISNVIKYKLQNKR